MLRPWCILLGAVLPAGRNSVHAAWRNSDKAAPPSDDLLSVSIIMPTNSRPEFVSNALEMIQRQDYQKLEEVIIVDDSPVSLRVPELVEGVQFAGHLRVVYITLPAPASIGAKRNTAVTQAVGDVIMHWDDDDLYGASRVAHQVAPLSAGGGADITLLQHQATYFLRSNVLKLANMTWKSTPSWGPHFGTSSTPLYSS